MLRFAKKSFYLAVCALIMGVLSQSLEPAYSSPGSFPSIETLLFIVLAQITSLLTLFTFLINIYVYFRDENKSVSLQAFGYLALPVILVTVGTAFGLANVHEYYLVDFFGLPFVILGQII